MGFTEAFTPPSHGEATMRSPHAFRSLSVHRAHRPLVAIAALLATLLWASASEAQQVVYYYPPVVAAPVPVIAQGPAYVANYSPTDSYASVTAYSPPVVAAMPTSSVAVTSYYAPAPAVTTAYAPAIVTPVTAYYAPAVAVPVYRRGLFGRYRPAGTAVVPAY
jgi:hypothetical protein